MEAWRRRLSPLGAWEIVGSLGWLECVPSAWEEHQGTEAPEKGPLTAPTVIEHLHVKTWAGSEGSWSPGWGSQTGSRRQWEPCTLRGKENDWPGLYFGHRDARNPVIFPHPCPDSSHGSAGQGGDQTRGQSLSAQPPYILTHFPGRENSHQGAGRREEQVAVAAKRFLGPLSHCRVAELFVSRLVCAARTAQCCLCQMPPACLPSISAPASQVSSGAWRRQEDRKRHPHFTDLGSLRGHSAACFTSRGRNHRPGERRVLPRAGKHRPRDTRSCAQRRPGRRAPGFWCPCRIPAQDPAWLPWASARLAGLVSSRPEGPGWWMRGLVSRQTAIPPASCQEFTCSLFWPASMFVKISEAGDGRGWARRDTQSEEEGETPGGHGQRGEFLKGAWPIFW